MDQSFDAYFDSSRLMYLVLEQQVLALLQHYSPVQMLHHTNAWASWSMAGLLRQLVACNRLLRLQLSSS